MAEIADLVKEVESLNKDCRKMHTEAEIALTRRDTARMKYCLREAGRMLVDFYKNNFPKYSEVSDGKAAPLGLLLEHLSLRASEAIKKNFYFTLSTLLVPRGSQIGDPNYLERAVLDLTRKP